MAIVYLQLEPCIFCRLIFILLVVIVLSFLPRPHRLAHASLTLAPRHRGIALQVVHCLMQVVAESHTMQGRRGTVA
jgi:hypothetical protein